MHLSERDAEIVAQVIELTRPLREYLRRRNDPSWKFLFLQCGKGFSYPRRVRVVEETSTALSSIRIRNSFLATGTVAFEDADRLAKRFSLTSLRASVAVCHYLKDPNVQKLAKLLGHKKLDMAMLQRYLPAPLLSFFQERWIRLFQCGLLVEALKDSPQLLPATGFASLDEVTEFLSNHALKWKPRGGNGVDVPSLKSSHFTDKVIFSINVENLTLLESLRVAVESMSIERISRLAQLWHDYAVRLFAFIENSHPPRDDFKEMLNLARGLASQDLLNREELYA
ncbi:hypothetical protein M3I54_40735 [Paraburkholderia sp. CNPSo 3274]|uniref:hypothetical protein n=1 Tax=Paraburkholderia sp. CNPSo 3274 TaxID=2940932 RepID=UPI0020B8B009|nr:hypothetical protein [Paraburkholderia sp. CNPSo 3274]MCP3713138.1 hypothetical protein [Paraburkholderia sp. CNPSo 3274]